MYVKKGKCDFARKEINFLGHKISKGKVKMDESKVNAIVNWNSPCLSLSYDPFWVWQITIVNSFKAIPKVSLLTDLLKKGQG